MINSIILTRLPYGNFFYFILKVMNTVKKVHGGKYTLKNDPKIRPKLFYPAPQIRVVFTRHHTDGSVMQRKPEESQKTRV